MQECYLFIFHLCELYSGTGLHCYNMTRTSGDRLSVKQLKRDCVTDADCDINDGDTIMCRR